MQKMKIFRIKIYNKNYKINKILIIQFKNKIMNISKKIKTNKIRIKINKNYSTKALKLKKQDSMMFIKSIINYLVSLNKIINKKK